MPVAFFQGVKNKRMTIHVVADAGFPASFFIERKVSDGTALNREFHLLSDAGLAILTIVSCMTGSESGAGFREKLDTYARRESRCQGRKSMV